MLKRYRPEDVYGFTQSEILSQVSEMPAVKKMKSLVKTRRSKKRSRKFTESIFTKPELKQKETYASQFALSAPVESFISGIAEGTGALEREGRVIQWKNLRVRLAFASQSTATLGTSIHWAVVLDRQPNGATITYANVFDSSVVTDPMMRYKNTTSYDARFKILREGTCFVGLQSASDANVIVDEFIDLSKLNPEDRGAKYIGTGGAITDVGTNALYVIYGPSSQAAYAEGTVTLRGTMSSKLRFIDV